jgi:hypothetical protein
MDMPAVTLKISRFVDDSFPGFVECLLEDADGTQHRIVEKAPVVLGSDPTPSGALPANCAITCTVAAEWTDERGRALVMVDTMTPHGIESVAGQSQFVVDRSAVRW